MSDWLEATAMLVIFCSVCVMTFALWKDDRSRREANRLRQGQSIPFPLGNVRGLQPGRATLLAVFVCYLCQDAAQVPLNERLAYHGEFAWPLPPPEGWKILEGWYICPECMRQVTELASPIV